MKRLSLTGLHISSVPKDNTNSGKDTSNDTAASTSRSSPSRETATEITDDDSDGTHDESQNRNSHTNVHHNSRRRPNGFFGTLNTLRRRLNIRRKANRTSLGSNANAAVVSGSTSNVSCNNSCMHSTSPQQRCTLQRYQNGEKSRHSTVLDWPIRAARSDNALNVDVRCKKCNGSSKPVPLPRQSTGAVKGSSTQMLLVDTEYGHASAPVVSQTNDALETPDHQKRVHSDKLVDWNLEKYQAYGSGPLETALHALQPVYDEVKDGGASSSGRPGDSGWSLTRELVKLSNFGWYWGPITRVEAEEKLSGQADGAFLVRDSSDARYLLSLSFRSYSHTLHTRIEHCNGVFSFYSQPESDGYGAIVDLIEHSMNDSRAGVFCYSRARMAGSPSFPVRLTRPVSRFAQVRTLQYLCRFVIRQYTRLDHIQRLPLPGSIKGWLEENQY